MGYDYQTEMRHVAAAAENEDCGYCGLKAFLAVRDKARDLLRLNGCFEAQQAMERVTGSAWTMLAALDWMVEHGEVEEVTPEGRWAQHRVFAAVRKP